MLTTFSRPAIACSTAGLEERAHGAYAGIALGLQVLLASLIIPLLFCFVFLFLAVAGAGSWSLDALRSPPRHRGLTGAPR